MVNLNQINNNSASQQNSQLCQSPTVRWHISKHIRLHRRRCKRNFKLYEHLKEAKKILSPSANVTAKANLPDASQTAVATRWSRGRERAFLPFTAPSTESEPPTFLSLSLSPPTNLLSLSLSHSESVVSRKTIPAPAREWQLPRQGGSVQQQHGGVLQGI